MLVDIMLLLAFIGTVILILLTNQGENQQ